VFKKKAIPVIIYSNHRGTYLRDSVLSEFLLSSEDTAFEMDVLAQCNNLLVIGAVPFSNYAASYNRCFQYCKMANDN